LVFVSMIGNYETILEKIASSSGLEKEEVERRIEAKRAKLSGLISKEGAAQVIAAELGISFENERLKINELLPGMRRINLVGKIINIFPVRTFTKNGQESKVANMVIADETSNIKVVLWDVNHIDLIEKNKIGKETVVELSNGSMRGNEIHLGSFSELKQINEELNNVVTEKVVKEKIISDLQLSESAKVRAFVVQVFEPKFFEVCPECGKKANPEADGVSCAVHGKIVPKKRALMNFVLDDGTETIRAVMFSENFAILGFDDLEDSEKISDQKQDLLGKEMFFSGDVRNNKYFNNTELIVDNVKEVNPDALIQELENKK
jgi:ssDNA-binding replication factor A large subunit